jgi:uncharacterized protein DUF6515
MKYIYILIIGIILSSFTQYNLYAKRGRSGSRGGSSRKSSSSKSRSKSSRKSYSSKSRSKSTRKSYSAKKRKSQNVNRNYGSIRHNKVYQNQRKHRSSVNRRKTANYSRNASRTRKSSQGEIKGRRGGKTEWTRSPGYGKGEIKGPRGGKVEWEKYGRYHKTQIKGPNGKVWRSSGYSTTGFSYYNSLPGGYKTISYSGTDYYYYDDVYFRRSYSDGDFVYMSIPPPIGAILYELPGPYTIEVINGITHYWVYDACYVSITVDGIPAYRRIAVSW